MYSWYDNDRLGPSQHTSSWCILKQNRTGKYPQDQHKQHNHHYTVLNDICVVLCYLLSFCIMRSPEGG